MFVLQHLFEEGDTVQPVIVFEVKLRLPGASWLYNSVLCFGPGGC